MISEKNSRRLITRGKNILQTDFEDKNIARKYLPHKQYYTDPFPHIIGKFRDQLKNQNYLDVVNAAHYPRC